MGLTTIPDRRRDRGRRPASTRWPTGSVDTGISISLPAVGRSLGFAAAAGAVIAFVRDLERGEPAGFVRAYRRDVRALLAPDPGTAPGSPWSSLLALTVIGIPIAIWKYIDWQFVQQEILFKDKSIRDAFRGSTRTRPGHWWRTLADRGILLAAQRRRGPGARVRADLRQPLADLDQHHRLARLRAPGPLRGDRPHAAVLRSPGAPTRRDRAEAATVVVPGASESTARLNARRLEEAGRWGAAAPGEARRAR